MKSFTLFELLIVLVFISLFAITAKITFFNNSIDIATDLVISHIRFTQMLALNDDKFYPFLKKNSIIEQNKSKYWFKRWWQIRFTKNRKDKHLWYEIFSDLPTDAISHNFDKIGYTPDSKKAWEMGYAKDEEGFYLTGKCGENTYPPCNKINHLLDLTQQYKIKEIIFNDKKISSTSSKRILFDNFGNLFLNEGLKGDSEDINPLDEIRKIVDKNITIKICLDENCKDLSKLRCRKIIITPTGAIKKVFCK